MLHRLWQHHQPRDTRDIFHSWPQAWGWGTVHFNFHSRLQLQSYMFSIQISCSPELVPCLQLLYVDMGTVRCLYQERPLFIIPNMWPNDNITHCLSHDTPGTKKTITDLLTIRDLLLINKLVSTSCDIVVIENISLNPDILLSFYSGLIVSQPLNVWMLLKVETESLTGTVVVL